MIEKNQTVAIGPWFKDDTTEEWLVTKVDEVSDGEVFITIEDTRMSYPLNDPLVTTSEDGSNKGQLMIKKFEESDYIKTMEVTISPSGSIAVEGI